MLASGSDGFSRAASLAGVAVRSARRACNRNDSMGMAQSCDREVIMVTSQEIELLFSILARAGVTQIEAWFLNSVLDRLRIMVAEQKIKDNELDTNPEK